MTATTAEVIELKQPAASRTARKDLYEIGEIPPLGHVPANMYAWVIRKDRHGEPISAMQQEVVPTADDRRRRVPGHGDGRGRQLQRRLGGARHPALAARRPQAALPHRRLRRVGHRLCRGLQGEALEGRRRGRHPLQPGRRRRRGVQRRRSDELAEPADLGLRDHRRQLRPVLQGAVAPADAAAQAPDLGGGRLLHAGAGDRLPDAVRPSRRTRSSPATTCWSGAVPAAWARWRSS